jgi:hypothetical protein
VVLILTDSADAAASGEHLAVRQREEAVPDEGQQHEAGSTINV